MRCLFALLFGCVLLPTAAEAGHRHQPTRYARHLYRVAPRPGYVAPRYAFGGGQWSGRERASAPRRYHAGYGHFSGSCSVAAAKGGPCGCEAMKLVGLSDRRFWLVRNWRAFPRTTPHVGAAALWGNQHVEIVTAVNGDGTVNTAGSVGHTHVRLAYLTFVEPHGSGASYAAAKEQVSVAAPRSRYTARVSHRYASALGSYRGRPMHANYREVGWATGYAQDGYF
jgi:hypothetical protein